MTISVSSAAQKAYEFIDGPLAKVNKSYPNAKKILTTIQDRLGTDPKSQAIRKGISSLIVGGDKGKKVLDFLDKIKDLLDEKQRQGAFLTHGLEITSYVAKTVLGMDIAAHPYFALHKVAIQLLVDTLNADNNSRAAVDAFNQAVGAANSDKIAAQFKQLESDKVDLVPRYSPLIDKIRLIVDAARGTVSEEFAAKKFATYGMEQIRLAVVDLEAFRANWAGLCFNALQLQIMTNVQLRATQDFLNRSKGMLDALAQGHNVGRVGRLAAVNSIELEKYDQIVNQKKPDMALMDPVRFAKGNCDKAAAWARAMTEMCDFVRSEDVIWGSKYEKQLDALNKVLYG